MCVRVCAYVCVCVLVVEGGGGRDEVIAACLHLCVKIIYVIVMVFMLNFYQLMMSSQD